MRVRVGEGVREGDLVEGDLVFSREGPNLDERCKMDWRVLISFPPLIWFRLTAIVSVHISCLQTLLVWLGWPKEWQKKWLLLVCGGLLLSVLMGIQREFAVKCHCSFFLLTYAICKCFYLFNTDLVKDFAPDRKA